MKKQQIWKSLDSSSASHDECLLLNEVFVGRSSLTQTRWNWIFCFGHFNCWLFRLFVSVVECSCVRLFVCSSVRLFVSIAQCSFVRLFVCSFQLLIVSAVFWEKSSQGISSCQEREMARAGWGISILPRRKKDRSGFWGSKGESCFLLLFSILLS